MTSETTPAIAAAPTLPLWWREWDRAAVIAAIEEASGAGLAAGDPLPDTLIANAQEFGLRPAELRMWIYDQPKRDWSIAELATWAKRYGLARAVQPAAQPEAAA